MGEGLSRAVLKVFVELYREGLIYKDKRLVNWDPKLLTAISDLEVQQVEVKGELWHFKYPIEGDARRLHHGCDHAARDHARRHRRRRASRRSRATGIWSAGMRVLPLVGRRIPIIADAYSDPEKGTGAVKITPAHDFNDFEVGRRHELPLVSVLDAEAKLEPATATKRSCATCRPRPSSSRRWPITVSTASLVRKQIVARMEAAGLLAKSRPHTLTRCRTAIAPGW